MARVRSGYPLGRRSRDAAPFAGRHDVGRRHEGDRAIFVQFGDLVALAAALGWAGTTVLARFIARAIPALWYNALRVGIAALAMLALLPWTLGQSDLSRLSVTSLALLLIFTLLYGVFRGREVAIAAHDGAEHLRREIAQQVVGGGWMWVHVSPRSAELQFRES